MPILLVAVLGFNPERASQLLVNCLAVGGGFLVGYWLTAFIAYLIDRWLTKNRAPHGLHRVARILGGLALAVLVALVVFGHGAGWTLFGGGGSGNGNSEGTTTGTNESGAKTQPTSPAKVEPVPPPPTEAVPPEQRVRVTLLGGEDVKGERFYLIGDDRTPHTLAEVEAAVRAKKDATDKPVGLEILFSPSNTLPRNHPAVLRLTNWAQSSGITVTFPGSR
jgi:hypothetical protein